MEGFVCCCSVDCSHWRCHPDASSAHHALLTALSEVVGGVFLPSRTPIGHRRKGNLGEFVALHIGRGCNGLPNHRAFPANALHPLQDISCPGIDVVWVLFGPSPKDDSAILQEVKTTSAEDLSLAYDLSRDYEKLFGTDPSRTLKSRLSAVKNTLEISLGQPSLAHRLTKFIGVDPLTCQNVTLLPTVVYDPLVAPSSTVEDKMVIVRTTISGLGWEASSVGSWTIGLDDLDIMLQKLAEGTS